MNRLTCTACDEPIPNGEAVTTSRLFDQRHWHREHAPELARIPEQRRPVRDETSSVRLRVSAVDLRM